MLAVRRSLLIEALQVLLVASLVFLGIRLLLDNFRVQGGSMEPSLSDGQYLVINKAVYLRSSWLDRLNPFGDAGGEHYVFRPPRRGDIVVFQPPRPSIFPYIKRVIGVPRDTVEVRRGEVFVNGYALVEPYLREAPRRDFPRQVVPAGHVFVMGDNRNHSEDSTIFGMLPAGNIVGKAWVKYWPPSEWGFAPNVSLAGRPSQ